MEWETETLKMFSSHSMNSKLSYFRILDDQHREEDISRGKLTPPRLDAYVWVQLIALGATHIG